MSDKNKTADYDVSADDEFVIEDEIEDDELATVLDESLSSDDLALPEMTEQLTELNCLPSQNSDFVQEKSTCRLNGHYDSEAAHSPLTRESQAEQIGLHEELCEFDGLVVEDAIEEDRESEIREDFAKAEHTFDTAENPEQATAEYSPDKENALHEIAESSSEVELSDRVLESGSGEPEVLPITNPTAQTLDHVQTKSYSEANVTVVELPAVSSQDLNVEPGTFESGGEFSADSLVQHLQEDNKENVEKVSIRCAAVDSSCDDTKTEQDLKLDESGDQIEISASGSEAVVANATEDLKASQAEELMEVTEISEEAPATDEIDFDEFDVVDEIDDDDEEAEMGDSEEHGERSAQGEFLAKKRPLLMPTEKNFENSRPMGSTSPTLAFYELDKVGENEARTVKSPKTAKIQEPVTRRSEPLPEVALFVDSLTKVSFDWKKYTCFYCNPCHLYLTSTALWEDHMMEPSHKKNMVRWKMAVALQNEICSTSKLQQKIGACREFLMGADKVIEVAPDGNTTSFVCVLCNFVCTNFDYLILHLTGFGHIDTFMESVCSHLFRPPTLSSLPKNHKSNSRVVDEKWKSTILSEARKYVNRHGVGHLRTFSGDQYADWVDVDEDQQDMEEAILQEQVNDFLTDEHHSDVRAGVLAHNWSSANEEYEKMSTTQKDKYIGLQYLIELWAPSRSVIAVWYCTLCDSIAIDWTKHCESVQHIAAYLKKDYKTHAYDCAVLEANSEEELRSNFALAKSKVLQFEGYQARVKFVLQVQKLQEIDSFVAINAKIAKILVARQNFVIEPLARKPRKGDIKNIAEALKGAAKSTSPKSDRHRKERDTESENASKSKGSAPLKFTENKANTCKTLGSTIKAEINNGSEALPNAASSFVKSDESLDRSANQHDPNSDISAVENKDDTSELEKDPINYSSYGFYPRIVPHENNDRLGCPGHYGHRFLRPFEVDFVNPSIRSEFCDEQAFEVVQLAYRIFVQVYHICREGDLDCISDPMCQTLAENYGYWLSCYGADRAEYFTKKLWQVVWLTTSRAPNYAPKRLSHAWNMARRAFPDIKDIYEAARPNKNQRAAVRATFFKSKRFGSYSNRSMNRRNTDEVSDNSMEYAPMNHSVASLDFPPESAGFPTKKKHAETWKSFRGRPPSMGSSAKISATSSWNLPPEIERLPRNQRRMAVWKYFRGQLPPTFRSSRIEKAKVKLHQHQFR